MSIKKLIVEEEIPEAYQFARNILYEEWSNSSIK